MIPGSREDSGQVLAELDGANSTAEICVRTCHVCQATVACGRTYCTSCGHPLCKTCTCPIPEGADELHRAFEKSGGAHLTLRDGDTLTSYNRSVPASPIKERVEPLRIAEAIPSGKYAQTPEQPDVEPGHQHVKYVRHPAPTTTSCPKPRAPRKSSTSVRENPFIVADRISQGTPTASQHGPANQAPERTTPSEYVSRRSDADYQEEPCSDPACRATHSGYRPYRHRVGCKSRRTQVSDEPCAEDYEEMDYRPSREREPSPSACRYLAEPRRTDWSERSSNDYDGRYQGEPAYHAEDYSSQRRDAPRQYVVREPTYHDDRIEHHQPRSCRVRESTHHDDHNHYDRQPRRRARERTYFDERPETVEYVEKTRPRHTRERTRHNESYNPAYFSGPPTPETHQHRRSEIHERYHQHPHRHSPKSQTHSEQVENCVSAPPTELSPTSEPEPEPICHYRHDEPKIGPPRQDQHVEPTTEPVTHVPPPGSKDRPTLPHSKSTPSLQKAVESERKTEDFREVRSRLRKTNSLSPSKALLKLGPDPQSHSEHDSGVDQRSPPARLEKTTRIGEARPPPQEEGKSKESKAKEEEVPKLVRTKTDHTKCIDDNGWRPPVPKVRDHTKCIEDAVPAKLFPATRDPDKCVDEPRGRAREQAMPSTRETPRDHAARPAKQSPRETASRPAKMAETDHECGWKDKYITLQAEVDAQDRPGDIGLEGLTIILHMQGRDDLVINTDLRNLE